MHELSLCENMLSLLEESAQQEQFSQVLVIHLLVGELSCVESEALLFCFDAIKNNTLAQTAQLVIENVPGRAQCQACATELKVHSFAECCSACGGKLDVVAGDQIQIKFLEVC